MRKLGIFLKKAIVFGLILFILDLCLGEGLRLLYFRHAVGNRKNLFNIMEKSTAPILIFGSSRAQHHYIPQRFKEAFGADCFNAGLDGVLIEYEEAMLEAVLMRYSPKLIILDLNSGEFVKSSSRLKSLSRLLPYYRRHKEIRDIIKSRGITERIKLASHIYPFNSEIIQQILWNLLNEERFVEINGSDGYFPLTRVWNTPIKEQSQDNSKENIDSNAVNQFSTFIAKSKARNIRLFIVVSPIYQKSISPSASISIASEICRQEKVPFLDLSGNAEILAHREYFQDITHLNSEGAKVFTKLVIEELRAYEKGRKNIQMPAFQPGN